MNIFMMINPRGQRYHILEQKYFGVTGIIELWGGRNRKVLRKKEHMTRDPFAGRKIEKIIKTMEKKGYVTLGNMNVHPEDSVKKIMAQIRFSLESYAKIVHEEFQELGEYV